MPLIEHWYSALRARFGVKLRVTSGSKQLAIAKLYRARADAADLDLKNLSIVQSPTAADEIWIVKRKPNGATEE